MTLTRPRTNMRDSLPLVYDAGPNMASSRNAAQTERRMEMGGHHHEIGARPKSSPAVFANQALGLGLTAPTRRGKTTSNGYPDSISILEAYSQSFTGPKAVRSSAGPSQQEIKDKMGSRPTVCDSFARKASSLHRNPRPVTPEHRKPARMNLRDLSHFTSNRSMADSPRLSARSAIYAGSLSSRSNPYSGSGTGRSAPKEPVDTRANHVQRVTVPATLNTPRRLELDTSTSDGSRTRKGVDTKMRDFHMLAAACKRAGKVKDEALSYYNMGVLCDNLQEFPKAIQNYKHFLALSRASNDTQCEALALNSLGVAYQNLGRLEEAVMYHVKHLDIADVAGKFTAHSNLGLAFSEMGEHEKASLNHRQALRYAILMSSLPGESLACGNLGVIGTRKGDIATARACMERHLKLAGSLKDAKGRSEALQQLGLLANSEGQYDAASNYLQEAMSLSRNTQERAKSNMAKCQLGVARGNQQFQDYISNVAEQLNQAMAQDDDGDAGYADPQDSSSGEDEDDDEGEGT